MRSFHVRAIAIAVLAVFIALATTLLASSVFAQSVAKDSASPVVDETEVAVGGIKKIHALIIDGQNNHTAWPKSTFMMRDYLLETGKFTVDVERTKFTWKGGELLQQFSLNDGKEYKDLNEAKTDPDFNPDFSKYDVVISNFGYKAAEWPEQTKAAFENYMKNGGGFVSIHAADNCFPKWKEYNRMIGLGGWDGRQNRGNYLYLDDRGEVVLDDSDGPGGDHGPRHEFSIVFRNSNHPITQGLPAEFMHTKDELYQSLRGPAENVTVLATAFANPDKKGTGRHEPMLMTIDYEKGRVFHSTLGHADYSFECVGFQTTFVRGTEWAATGKVTIEVPEDFPTADKSSARKYRRGAVITE